MPVEIMKTGVDNCCAANIYRAVPQYITFYIPQEELLINKEDGQRKSVMCLRASTHVCDSTYTSRLTFLIRTQKKLKVGAFMKCQTCVKCVHTKVLI